MRIIPLALLAAILPSAGHTHDMWADGSSVPRWVSQSCCGPADAHRLSMEQVHQVEFGWRVDGYPYVISDDKVLPSQDGYPWIFYKDLGAGNATIVYCFFLPLTF